MLGIDWSGLDSGSGLWSWAWIYFESCIGIVEVGVHFTQCCRWGLLRDASASVSL